MNPKSAMKESILFCGLMLCALLYVSCEGRQPEKQAWQDVELSPAERHIAERNTAFAFRFFQKATQTDATCVLSPLSASCLLSLLMNGADSDCLAGIRTALRLDSIPMETINTYYNRLIKGLPFADPLTEVGLHQSLWIEEEVNIEPTFRKVSHEEYNAEICTVDFSAPDATERVNRWCAEKTNNRITKVVDTFHGKERLALLNALYFQGKWQREFNKEWTRPEPFTASDGTVRQVEMMCQTDTFRLLRNEYFDIAELPYGNDTFSMILFLPAQDKDWETCRTSFTAENWLRWSEDGETRRLDLRLPRFRMEERYNLSTALRALGMGKAFNPSIQHFPRLAKGELGIGEVLQSVFISVDEGGTEAAAATIATIIAEEELPPSLRPYPFHVNRPFLFLIKENKTGAILFMGQVTNM